MADVKCVLIHDHFQNAKQYNIPRAQLMIADIPYNLGRSFYASRPDWYVDGDNTNGESDKAHKAAFNTDFHFNIADFFAFGSRLLKKEPARGEKDAPCMIVFCSFQQQPVVIGEAAKHGFKHYTPVQSSVLLKCGLELTSHTMGPSGPNITSTPAKSRPSALTAFKATSFCSAVNSIVQAVPPFVMLERKSLSF